MKLLAKNAEERYQTAFGLETDLRQCLAQWESHGRIDPFPLGTHDASDQFRIPEKLYGREREVDALLAAFERVVADGTPELVLVSGYSGIGKSSMVNELHKVLVPPRGLFASGKFDQYKRDIPYTTLAQAFQMLVRQFLAKNEAEVDQWRHALREAVGPNGALIINLIPEVEFLIGTQPPVPDLPPQDDQNRFHTVFRRFLGAFARPEHPLALFLDDLQWLDAATLELLEHLITDPDVRHILLVGAYRDNEVTPSDPLMRTLETIHKAGARRQDIVLAPLAMDDLGRLVADSLHSEQEAARPLTQLVHEKTGRQSVLRDPVPDVAGRGRTACIRRRRGGLDLGLGEHPRQGLHRQRRGAHGRQIEAAARQHAGRSQATRLSRKRSRVRHPDAGSRGVRRGSPRVALGGRPHRADLPPRRLLRVPPRSCSGGSICAHPRQASVRRHTFGSAERSRHEPRRRNSKSISLKL